MRAAAFTVRRLEDDVEHALATGYLDPALLPALPGLPAGVQIGAEPMGCDETMGSVATAEARAETDLGS